MRTIDFKELLTILDNAEAIQLETSLVYPVVGDDFFNGVGSTNDDIPEYYEKDIDSIIINDNGHIEFVWSKHLNTVYTISVLEDKKLA